MRLILGMILFFVSHLHAVDIVLYYSSTCPYSQKVLHYLDSIDKTVPMKDVTKLPEAKKELFEIGGIKIVPCLFIDTQPLYDANNIIDWLSSHQNLLSKKTS